jgi:hypothetical protein
VCRQCGQPSAPRPTSGARSRAFISLVTGASPASARLYQKDAHPDAAAGTTTESATVPIGLAFPAGGGVGPNRRFVDRDDQIVVSCHECATGVHYAAHQAPDVLVARPGVVDGAPLANRANT